MAARPTRTKIRDAVALMVLLGTWLVMPPMLGVVNQPTTVLGIPSIVVYVFAVWGGLIVFTRVMARRAGRVSTRVEEPTYPEREAG
ncbi:MAG: hypothetical protein P1U88_08990 [Thalassobaculaceae bacterium]|nr:hypothetical protein [Thalassobaculaceae bacterium]